MDDSRAPVLQWAQRIDRILLRIMVRKAEDVTLRIADAGSIDFTASTADGTNWAASCHLFAPVEARRCSWKVMEAYVDVTLYKKQVGRRWERLLDTPERDSKVKVDWDRWVDEEEEESKDGAWEFDPEDEQKMAISMPGEKPFGMREAYLTLLNGMLGVMWAWLFTRVFFALFAGQQWFLDVAGEILDYVLLAHWLEVVNALAGITRSSAASAIFQTSGRTFVWFGAARLWPQALQSPAVLPLVAVWAAADAIRCAWLFGRVSDNCPAWLTRLRYSAFIVLYPLGFLAEAAVCYATLKPSRYSDAYSWQLPNAHNIIFDYHTFMRFFLVLAYTTAAPYLYWHMWKQRARKMEVLAQEQAIAEQARQNAAFMKKHG